MSLAVLLGAVRVNGEKGPEQMHGVRVSLADGRHDVVLVFGSDDDARAMVADVQAGAAPVSLRKLSRKLKGWQWGEVDSPEDPAIRCWAARRWKQ